MLSDSGFNLKTTKILNQCNKLQRYIISSFSGINVTYITLLKRKYNLYLKDITEKNEENMDENRINTITCDAAGRLKVIPTEFRLEEKTKKVIPNLHFRYLTSHLNHVHLLTNRILTDVSYFLWMRLPLEGELMIMGLCHLRLGSNL